jgi:hypothetical protein
MFRGNLNVDCISVEAPLKLSARPLKNVVSANAFDYADAWTSRQEDASAEAQRIYFQIVDLDRGSPDSPLRFMPIGTTITAELTFPNLDDALKFSLAATRAFPSDDRSIWYVDLPADKFPSAGAVMFSLTVDAVTYKWRVENIMAVETLNAGMC